MERGVLSGYPFRFAKSKKTDVMDTKKNTYGSCANSVLIRFLGERVEVYWACKTGQIIPQKKGVFFSVRAVRLPVVERNEEPRNSCLNIFP